MPAWFPSRIDRMSGLFVLQLATAVEKYTLFESYVLHIQAANDRKKSLEWLDGEVKGLIIYLPKHATFSSRFSYPFRYLLNAWLGYAGLKKKYGKMNLTHVQVLTRPGITALLLKGLRGIPYLITEHWSRYFPQNKQSYSGILRKILTRLVVSRSEGLYTVSRPLLQAMADHGLKHAHTAAISNAVDTDFFIPAGKTTNTSFQFLHVSCFDEKTKNVKGILDAFYQLQQQGLNCRLNLVGHGPDWELCKEYAAELGLNSMVNFTGVLEHEELLKAYQQADCFVLFSYYETQGIVLLEAMSCGVPVIATSTGGITDFVNDENGILVTPGDLQALVSAMKKMQAGEITFDPEKLRSLSIRIASEKSIAATYAEIYTRIITTA